MLANKKPWGHECLAYQNENVAIWHLFIDPWQETSLHCHPNKKTGLVVLEGGAKVSFLSGAEKLFAGDKVMIRQGVFHRTRNMTKHPLQLFEIETPVNKADLVRIEDKYSRPSVYGNEPTIDIQQEYPWNKPSSGQYWRSLIGSVSVGLEKLTETSYDFVNLDNFYDPNSVYMITKGGLHKDGVYVCGPGDVLSGANLELLSSKFALHDNFEGIRVTCEY